jgi:transcriptional regulator with XRE-family HTH domain
VRQSFTVEAPVSHISRSCRCLEYMMKLKRSEKSPIDKHVGSRIRMRRMMLGMSQSGLANALGITFQQVQKYEKGSNRVGASRLQHTSQALQVPVSFFFEGVSPDQSGQTSLGSPNELDEFMSTRDGLALAKAFMRIKNIQLRRQIVAFAEELVDRRR